MSVIWPIVTALSLLAAAMWSYVANRWRDTSKKWEAAALKWQEVFELAKENDKR